ncbi:MAG: oligosaccharide flippase family protein [Ginsengibacter sp.]
MIFFRNSIISLIAYGLYLVLSIGLNVFVSRIYGPEGSGTLALLVLFSGTVSLIFNFGLGQAAVYFLGQKIYSEREIVNNLFSMCWLIGLPVAALLIVSLPLYGNIMFSGIPITQVVLIIAITPFTIGKLYVEYIFAGIHNFLWNSGLNIIDIGLRLVLIAIFLPFDLGLEGIVFAIMISTFLSFIFGWYRMYRRTNQLKISVQPLLLSRMSKYGLSSYTSNLVTFLNLRLDQFLVGIFLPLDQLGLYLIAVIIAELPMKLATGMTKVLFSKVSSLGSADATRITNATMRTIMTLAAISTAILYIIGPALIQLLFGNKFTGATSALWFLLPGALLFNFTQILYSDLSGRGKPAIGMYASLVSLVITLLGNIILTPKWGINGAAFTSSVSYFVAAIIIVTGYLRTTGQSLHHLLWFTGNDKRYVLGLLRQSLTSLKKN